MAPRPNWKGYLKLSLVSCPIALYPATSASERISFRQINKKTGNRLRQQLVDEVSREPVEAEDKGPGYEIAKGQYIQIEDDELEAIQVESTHTIEIEKFVPLSEIDVRFELESKSKKTKAPPLQPVLAKKKPQKQRARG
jgi:DNA end-binding protein Ku